MATPCPVCGSSDAPKFSSESDWCAPCAGEEVRVQRTLAKPKQAKQLVERGVGVSEFL